jgi:O-antigen ligase
MYQNPVDGQRQNPLAPNLLATVRQSLFLAVFASLPVIGLIAGPSYAPLLFGLAGLSALIVGLESRRLPALDKPVALLALLFVLLCAAGLFDTFSPRISRERVGQMAGISVGCLLLLAMPVAERQAGKLISLLFWAVALGVAILGIDTALDFPLQHILGGDAVNIGTKYNRGLIALVILTWPLAANLVARGERGKVRLLIAFVLLASLIGLSATGLAALLAGFFVWLVASKAPRFATIAVGAGVSFLALALPLLMRIASGERGNLASVVKSSGIHRLEIWDYMSARILERPLTGWGLGVAKVVPIQASELATYLYADATGIYPHNQWIELWLETGLPGVMLALALVLLVLSRLRGRWGAYGLAAVAAALTGSLLNFEITTDSWWAALAAAAVLYRLLPKDGPA